MKEIKDIIDRVHCCDCLEFMKEMPPDCIDTIITDPPYGLGFMGKGWDTFKPEFVSNYVPDIAFQPIILHGYLPDMTIPATLNFKPGSLSGAKRR